MREELLRIIEKLPTDKASKFQSLAKVKEKTVQGALKNYAKGCPYEDIIAIMDTTIMNGGKEGFLLTSKKLYSDNFKKNPVSLEGLIEVKSTKKSHLLLIYDDGHSEERYFSIYSSYIETILQVIIDYNTRNKISAPATSDQLLIQGQASNSKQAPISASPLQDEWQIYENEKLAFEREKIAFKRELQNFEILRRAFEDEKLAFEEKKRTLEDEILAFELKKQALEDEILAFENKKQTLEDESLTFITEKPLEDIELESSTPDKDETASSVSPEQIEEWYQKALQVSDTEDFDSAIALYKKAAEHGHEYAAFNLALHYYYGERDFEKAIYWLEPYARSGDIDSQSVLSDVYEDIGDGEKCLFWLNEGANQGSPDMQCSLGLHYLSGKFLDQDLQQAKYWLEKSAAQGSQRAKEALLEIEQSAQHQEQSPISDGNKIFLAGIQAYQDKEYGKAITYLEKAAQLGEEQAPKILARCYLNGQGVSADKDKALFWLEKSAEQGDSDEQFLLGTWYLPGGEGTVNLERAEYWFEKSAKQGNDKAKEGLRIIRRNKGVEYYNAGMRKIKQATVDSQMHLTTEDLSDALPDLEKAGELDLVEAQSMLASYYLYGNTRFSPKLNETCPGEKDIDKEKGIYWLKRAVKNQDPYSTFTYAKYLFFGDVNCMSEQSFDIGRCPRYYNQKEALDYAVKASDLGCQAAYLWLEQAKKNGVSGAANALERTKMP